MAYMVLMTVLQKSKRGTLIWVKIMESYMPWSMSASGSSCKCKVTPGRGRGECWIGNQGTTRPSLQLSQNQSWGVSCIIRPTQPPTHLLIYLFTCLFEGALVLKHYDYLLSVVRGDDRQWQLYLSLESKLISLCDLSACQKYIYILFSKTFTYISGRLINMSSSYAVRAFPDYWRQQQQNVPSAHISKSQGQCMSLGRFLLLLFL